MTPPAYEFRFGDLYHVGRGTRVCGPGDSLGLVVGQEGTVYKHGAEPQIRRWMDAQQQRLGAEPDADPGLTLLVFPATEDAVDALNGLIAGRGGVAHMMERLSRLTPVPPKPS